MRVLIVTQYFWPEEFRINDLAAELVRRGHDVTVLTGEPSYPSRSLFPGYGGWRHRRQVWNGVRVRRVPLLSRGHGQGWRLALNYLSFALSATLLGPLVVRADADAVFVYEPSPVTVGLPAVVLKRLKRAPMVFWVQDLWPETLEATEAVSSRRVLDALRRFVRWLYRHSDRILVESKSFEPKILDLGVDARTVSYLPNWAESAYVPVQLPGDAPERDLVPQGFCVMFAGNLGTAQSLDTLLTAAELLRDHPDVHWVILGDGRQRAWLEQEVAARRLESVRLLGRWPVESMPRFFSLADALVVTLRSDPLYARTIPSKVQSYLASGRAVLGALDGEGRRVIEDSRGGVAVPAEDAPALAAAVLSLKEMSSEERASLGARGRAYFLEHYERGRLLNQLEGILVETAQGRACAS